MGDRSASAVSSTPAASASNCRAGEEQYCLKGEVRTYNSRTYDGGDPTYGG